MKIFVKAKPNAKEERIERVDPPSPKGFGRASEMHFVVAVKEPAKEGRANWAIERALAEYFKVSLSQVSIVSGRTSRQKIVEINLV